MTSIESFVAEGENNPLLRRSRDHRRRSCKPVIANVCLVVFLFTLIALLALLSVGQAARPEAAACSHNEPGSDEESPPNDPIFGIHLSPTTATGVLLYGNDTTTYLPLIRTSPEYRDVLRRLQRSDSRHMHKPHYGLFGYPIFAPGEYIRQRIRDARKSIGWPSSSDVGVLSQPLSQLRDAAALHLGCAPTEATLISPAIRALYDEDVLDMMVYARMQQLPTRREGYRGRDQGCEEPHELMGAYAGRGFGLCETWWNATQCQLEDEREGAYNETGTVVVLELSKGLLAATRTYHSLRSTMDTYWQADYSVAIKYFDEELDGYDWDAVRVVLESWVLYVIEPWKPPLTQLHLIGEGAVVDDHRLEHIVREAFMDYGKPEPPILGWNTMEAEYTGAIGAAQMGRRGRYIARTSGSDNTRISSGSAASQNHDIKRNTDLIGLNGAPDPTGCRWFSETLE